MGTTAQKLQNIINEKASQKTITNYGLSVANQIDNNTKFIDYPKYIFKGYIESLNNPSTLYNNLPKKTGTGTNITLNDTTECRMEIITCGNTTQTGTPTPDTPIPIENVTGLQTIDIVGKNLLNYGTQTFTTYYQEYGLNIPAGTYTFSANITSSDTTYTLSRVFFYDSSGNSLGYVSLNRNTRASGTITLNDTAVRVTLYASIDYSNSNGKTATYTNIQLEKGSSATEYEPYINNTYEINLGKNLISFANITNSNNGLNGSINGNTITVSGTNSKTDANWGLLTNQANQGVLPMFEKGVKYTISSTNQIASSLYFQINYFKEGTSTQASLVNISLANASYTFTVPNDYGSVASAFIGVYSTAGQIDYTTNLQIEKGSQATSYSPYFDPIYLNGIGDYKDRIFKSSGKNLFDKDNVEYLQGYIDTNTIVSHYAYRTIYIKCKPNTTYTLQRNVGTSQLWLAYTTTTPTLGGTCYGRTDSTTITTGNNATYLLAQVYRSNADTETWEQIISSVMIEKGSSTSPYEPYGTDWYIEKQIGKVVLDGTQAEASFESNSALNTTNYNCYYYLNNSLAKAENDSSLNAISDHFLGTPSNQRTSNLSNCWLSHFTAGQLYFHVPNTITSKSALNTWFSNNNTTFYTILTTPTYTKITNTELIGELESLYNATSYSPQTNISQQTEYLPFILNVSAIEDLS